MNRLNPSNTGKIYLCFAKDTSLVLPCQKQSSFNSSENGSLQENPSMEFLPVCDIHSFWVPCYPKSFFLMQIDDTCYIYSSRRNFGKISKFSVLRAVQCCHEAKSAYLDPCSSSHLCTIGIAAAWPWFVLFLHPFLASSILFVILISAECMLIQHAFPQW